jgi:Family of unknown function (DUF5681)
MPNSNRSDDDGVGYGRPPVATRFPPGQSGNPGGRPKGAKGTKATTKRVLMETRKVDVDGSGRLRKLTVLELTILLLKKLAASGDQRAYRTLMDLDRQCTPPESEIPRGYIIIPDRLTEEEWEAKYSPKDALPDDDPWG